MSLVTESVKWVIHEENETKFGKVKSITLTDTPASLAELVTIEELEDDISRQKENIEFGNQIEPVEGYGGGTLLVTREGFFVWEKELGVYVKAKLHTIYQEEIKYNDNIPTLKPLNTKQFVAEFEYVRPTVK